MAEIQTYKNLTAENAVFYDRTLLERLVPNLVWLKHGQKRTVPKNNGGQVNFRRFNSLDVSTTPLTEGVTPDGKSLDITNVTVPLEEYGDFVKISSKLNLLGVDPVLVETAAVLGEQAALTLDTIAMREVSSGTNVQYPNKKTDIDDLLQTDVMTAELIQKAVRTLRNSNAKAMDNGYYYGFINHNVAYDLQKDPLWQDVSKYNGGVNIEKGEIGKLHGVRFIDTTNTQVLTNANNIDIHSTVIIAKDAYGCVDLEGGNSSSPKVIVKDAGSSGSADPLEQRASAGWKALMAVKRLNEMAIVRIDTAATI